MIKGEPFGYKTYWLAIKANQDALLKNSIVKYFEMGDKADWIYGIERSYSDSIYLTPQVNDWVFIVSNFLIKYESIFKKISADIGIVQFFGSYRGVNYSEWRNYKDGKLLRHFSVAEGCIKSNFGIVSPIEYKLADKAYDINIQSFKDDPHMLEFIESRDPFEFLGDENYVMEVAAEWSINPQDMDKIETDGDGYLLLTKVDLK